MQINERGAGGAGRNVRSALLLGGRWPWKSMLGLALVVSLSTLVFTLLHMAFGGFMDYTEFSGEVNGVDPLYVSLFVNCSDAFQDHAKIQAKRAEIEKFMLQAQGTYRIPPIIHQFYPTKDVPQKVTVADEDSDSESPQVYNIEKFIKGWLDMHPTWTYMFWTEVDNSRLFRTVPELRKFWPIFLEAVPDSARAEISRFAYLYVFGGVFVDIDFEVKRSLQPLVATLDLFTSSEHMDHSVTVFDMPEAFSTAIMGSRPRHPFWLKMMDKIVEKISSPQLGPQCLTNMTNCMGPQILQRIYEDYVIFEVQSEPISMLPFQYFNSKSASFNPIIKKRCSSSNQGEDNYHCKYVIPSTIHKPYAVHHLLNDWSRILHINSTKPITRIVPPYQFRTPFD
eukprot:TRINITY_DN41867_c0_g1_i1.p1 TRINITY_DN41867_c0_g1~~TRINITY_DN41867_c0_g1_i1.p1  ORF type:complete len:395 (-),score=86.38 TRINITY_DN41867_c0_g1_i1:67-1251(-)